MRAPKVVKALKNRIINSIVVKINNLANNVSFDIKVPRNPPSIERDVILQANLEGLKS